VLQVLVVAVGFKHLAAGLALHFADHIDGFVELRPFVAVGNGPRCDDAFLESTGLLLPL
jgi:hypothetical protein